MEREKLIKLVTSAQRGDPKAIDTLFNAFYNDVYYFALKTVKDSDLACDITQDTFTTVISTLKDLKEPAAFVTWMKQIAYSHCTRFFKKKKEVLVDEDEDGHTIFDTVAEERTEFVPDEALDQEDFRKTILGMIDTLSEEQRSATMLYYYNEMTVKQIAEVQGVAEGTVKSRLIYARKAIKRSVEDYEKKNNVKLHSVALFPLIFWLFAGAEEVMPAAALPVVVGGITAATGTAVTAGSAAAAAGGATATATAAAGTGIMAKLVGIPLVAKVISGVVAASLVVGSVSVALLKDDQEPENSGTNQQCQHEWINADCVSAKTCSLCGTAEGAALGHTWLDANCTDPKICDTCQETEGDALGHSWLEADYQTAQTCSVCGTVEGAPRIPDFEKYGLSTIIPEMGVEYDYVTGGSDDPSQETVGKLYFSDYRTFESDGVLEAEEGYVWHSVVAEIRFDDDNAWDYGFYVSPCYENYYDIVGWDESGYSVGERMMCYTVTDNGIDYTQCRMTSSGATLSGWIGKTNLYYCEFSWRVPVGYDGFVLGFRDSRLTWEDGQHIFDVADENTLLFRFDTGGVGSNEPIGEVEYVPEGCTYIRANGVTLQAGEAMPATIYDGDELITPDYTYKYGYNYGYNSSMIGNNPNREFKYAGIDGWGVGVNDQSKTSYSSLLSYINGAPVTSLHGTFMYCENMTKAPTIPDTITDVEEAFYSCYSLIAAPVIPYGITSINSTFSNCTALVTVPELPNSIKDMSYAFSECRSLATAPVIPDGVKDLGGAFYNCELLTEAPVIPYGVTNLDSTFYNTNITKAPIMPAGVTNMDYTFYSCASLVEAPEIPYGVKSMQNTFYDCSALATAPEIPGSVTDLSGTFSGCASLVTVPALPVGITNMDSTFYECTSLVNAPAIPAGVTNMDRTFAKCTSLVNAPAIPAGVTNMNGAFRDCTSLKIAPDIPGSVTTMWAAFEACYALTTPPVIGEGVQSMGHAFYNCDAMKTAPNIPSTVTDLSYAFYGCNLIETISAIPEGVTDLSFAFSYCHSLKTVPVIPASVTDMSCTFRGCSALAGEIVINATITVDYDKCYLSSCSYCFNGGYVCENCPNCSTIEQCFADTAEPIILTGSCDILDKLAATSENGNVTVE